MSNDKKITVIIPVAVSKELEHIAEKKSTVQKYNISDVVRDAIEEYIAKEN